MTSISYGHNFENMADNNCFFKVRAELAISSIFIFLVFLGGGSDP